MEPLRLAANDLFRQGKIEEAIAAYQGALTAGQLSEENVPADVAGDVIEEAVKILGNLCTCYKKLGQSDKLVVAATTALSLRASFSKARALRAGVWMESSDPAVLLRGFAESCRSILLAPELATTFATPHAAIRERLLQRHARASREGVDFSLQSTAAGTGAFATAAVPAHAVVTKFGAPLAVGYYAETFGQGQLCVACGAAADDKPYHLGCTACASVAYCSNECAATYAARHALECRRFKRLAAALHNIEEEQRDGYDDVAEIGSHVITTLSAMDSEEGARELVERLQHHSDALAAHLPGVVALVCEIVDDVPAETVRRVAGACRCNSVQLSDASGYPCGTGLFTRSNLCYFNHSCSPNVAIDSERRRAIAIRDIAAGEELCFSYVPTLHYPTALRREALQERFYFRCACARCAAPGADELLELTLPGARADAQAHFAPVVHHLVEAARSRQPEQVDGELLNELRSLRAEVDAHLAPTHYLVQELRNATTFVTSALGAARLAAESSRDEWLMWESLFPGTALPVKCDKLRNVLLCAAELSAAPVVDKADEWLAAYQSHDI